jgi:hypothetical protein
MDDEKIESLYNTLREVSIKKKIPFIEPFLKVYLIPQGAPRQKNEDNSIPPGWIEKINRHSHSPVRNWYNWHFHICTAAYDVASFGDGSLVLKQTSAVLAGTQYGGAYNGAETFGYHGPAGDNTRGIQIGTGATAESIDDYVLSSLILHDSAPPTAGRMQYGLQQLTESWVINGTDYYTAERERVFNNASGGTITVRESGLVNYNDWLAGYRYLMHRDVFSDIAVANGESIAVSYELRVNFPETRT